MPWLNTPARVSSAVTSCTKIGRRDPIRVRHRLKIVPGVLRELVVVDGRPVGIDPPPLAKQPDAAIGSLLMHGGRRAG